MPIPFSCPKCQKAFKVKDELAGKRVICTACKAPIRVPAPTAAPAVPSHEAESLTVEALADEPPSAEAAAAEMIEMECPQCMEVVQFDAKFGGSPGKAKPKKRGPLKVGIAILGQNVVRHRGGGFGGSGRGTWVATKLFPEVGDRQGEVSFNYSLDEGKAEFSEKDSEYRDDLSFVFHSALTGK